MRPELERNMRNYGELMKYTSVISKEKYDNVKETMLEQAAGMSHTTKEAELEIYNIQKQKLERFRKFKRWLENTRKDEHFDDSANNSDKPVVSMTKEGVPTITYKDGTFKIATMGEVMSDMEWGEEYVFDKSVDIHTIREYHLNQLKKELREKLDEQIIESETSNTYVDTAKQMAYKQIKERNGNDSQMEKRGVVAEKMVATFIEQLSVDCEDADFTLLHADAYQDVNNKIDFIIQRNNRFHGAGVEESNDIEHITTRTVGIQFTTAEGLAGHKEDQLKKAKRGMSDVDDIVLVTIPMQEASYIYKKWNNNKQPGGPVKLWNNDTKANVFRAVMQNVLTGEEIEEFCEKHFK